LDNIVGNGRDRSLHLEINVNNMLKTPKEMFTITSFTAGSRRFLILNLKI